MNMSAWKKLKLSEVNEMNVSEISTAVFLGLIALAVGFSNGVMLGWVLWRKPYLEVTKFLEVTK